MKALVILKKSKEFRQELSESEYLSFTYKCSLKEEITQIDAALEELKELDSVLIDLLIAIELAEDEADEKRFTSIEPYLKRLSRFKK